MSKNQSKIGNDRPGITPDKLQVAPATIPEDGSHCPCCRLPFSDDRIPYINICTECADKCGDTEKCMRNRCNICGEGPATVRFNFIGQEPRESCAGCAVVCIQKGLG